MIELRGIETFYWIATLGSFRAASDKMHTSQPAVSQRIAQLESGLGVRLFDRDKRGLKLTAKGQALLPHAERMVQMKHDMLLVARAQNAVSGRLGIGVAETIVQTWLPALLERLSNTFPDLVLEIEVETTPILRSHLLNRQIDLAFLMGPLGEPNVENLPLCRYPLAWVASPQLDLGPEPISLEHIARWPVITYPSSSKPYQVVRDMLVQRGVKTPRMYGSASLSMVVRMALDSVGVSVIAPGFLDKELAEERLRIIDVESAPLPDLSFTASWINGSDSYAAAEIARLAVQIAESHGYGAT
ncbi:LysR family transcriptional regulator [Pseudomonas matsuisoli]|uniref:LysR family transcriptional regulator n=1 Tax=Pseudomonas matsuisoli TaxID=1515666 RepID=A0A917PY47_9PSED|nr:LysR family transcriptional regulator [Pseudomonas matsuisoli]GGJ98246.1 LysR family transcriptional regulator [Pseudomonas matsuisoli]